MQQFIRFLFIFSLTWLVLSLFGIGQPEKQYTDDIVLFSKDSYSIGSAVDMRILNNTSNAIEIPNDCAVTPLITEKYSNGAWEQISTERKSQNNCTDTVVIEAGEEKVFSYANESYELFGEMGKYRIAVDYDGKTFAHELEVTKVGFFKSLWHLLIYSPIFNLLIWLIEVLPGHSLGLAIILLTVIIKTALLVPNQKALRSQKAMQKLQPELQRIKKQYAGDQARTAQETMALWKKHGVNPAGSCLPILLQFPFLIAVFFILQKGLTPNNVHLIYDVLLPFDFSIVNPEFITMNLTAMGPWYLAIAVGAVQFIQMKLSFAQTGKQNTGKGLADQMQIMNKVFTYVMPGMIAIFTLTMPAGVGLYWGISTLYTLVQQQIVNTTMKGSYVEEDDKPKGGKSKKKKGSKKKSKEDDAEDAIIVHKV